MSRIELAEKVRVLREQGWLQREIAEELGISRSYTSSLCVDPSGALDRARKESYGGTCERCGARTTGSDGPLLAPKLCWHCAPTVQQRIWTRQTVTDAIREWARRRGSPPTAEHWILRNVDPDGYVFPPRSAVYDSQNGRVNPPFDSWADAIETAGFHRPTVGHKTKGKPTVSPSDYKATRTYLVLRTNDAGELEIVGETDASTNQEAVEQMASTAGRFSSVPKGSLQTFNLKSRLVADREVDGSRKQE